MSLSQLQDFIFHQVRKLPYVYSCYDDAEGHLIFFQIVNVDSVKLHTREKLKICDMTKLHFKARIHNPNSNQLFFYPIYKLLFFSFMHFYSLLHILWEAFIHTSIKSKCSIYSVIVGYKTIYLSIKNES